MNDVNIVCTCEELFVLLSKKDTFQSLISLFVSFILFTQILCSSGLTKNTGR